MLIVNRDIPIGASRVIHKLGKKIAPGVWNVIHPLNCECQMIHTVAHARWINYNQMDGIAKCDHCGSELSLPCPAVKDRIYSRKVWMDVSAIADDLWVFQLRHENCPPSAQELLPTESGETGQCSHLIRKPDGQPL